MYEPGTSYDEYLEKEQQKYPELSLNDIEELTERVKDNDELPPVPGTTIIRQTVFQLLWRRRGGRPALTIIAHFDCKLIHF